ncbi:MAG: ATP-dependent sacrificial sulfur transferase LarE [Deltaproteobacteria bacterium]|nr:ATP-dependent sacrificial sulfur transferase LarE [Deltaproteobacteria bacterium]MBW2118795.1 ATP-dependent sacrificial sulfur transferase LarE [Deltaproteobacteria bacterium]MBW2345372.1 ATP-dependent sacrificial sulfur transferase LarE [Deltaproteobacteria bacterium]
MDKNAAKQKMENLVHRLVDLDSLLVAFSGGVDSAFLLVMARQALGEKIIAATASSIIHPVRETEEAKDFVRERGISHVVFPSDELSIPGFAANGPDRCYICKRRLFQKLLEMAREKGIKHVAHGANLDDPADYRPGFRAAKEAGVIAPLIDAQLGKEDIRFLSKEMGLSTWDRPAMPCLATRFPYGSPITEENLKMVEDAESFLVEQGFKVVRVRHHGSVARVEIGRGELEKIMDEGLGKAIVEKFRKIGFEHVALDLEGYVSGSLNRAIGEMGEKG